MMTTQVSCHDGYCSATRIRADCQLRIVGFNSTQSELPVSFESCSFLLI